jgi:hypothetical protein
MTTTKSLTFLFAIAATGCATTPAVDSGGDDGSGDGSGSGSGDGSGSGTTPTPLDATGKYSMQSTFDISTNMPGTVGDVVNTIIAATDDPNDPTQWILDQIIANTSGTFHTLLADAEPFVAGYVNDQLLSIAPNFVTTMIEVGADFGDMAKHFGLNETLNISGTPGNYMSVHTVLGAHFTVEGTASDYAFSDYNVSNVVVNGVGVTMDNTGKLAIANHNVPLAYGKVLRIGMDAAIIPLVDSNATDLPSLLSDLIDCAALGQTIADAIGFGGAGTYETACTAGLNAAANLIYSKIAAIDAAALQFGIAGTAKGVDSNSDHKVDKLTTGAWTGTLSYSGTPSTLAPATFTGARM